MAHKVDHEGVKRRKIHRVMGEFKRGTLKSRDGSPVEDRSQAIAIALSEAQREAGLPRVKRKPLGP